MILLDLYAALRPLDDITGATTADDILNLIFSSFLYWKVKCGSPLTRLICLVILPGGLRPRLQFRAAASRLV